MRFTSKIQLWLPGEVVMRSPTFWEGLLSAFGAKPDLRAKEVVTTRTVLSIAEGMSGSLWHAGITNAVALVVDRQVLFQDKVGQSGDVPFLVAAARQFAPQFARGFNRLHAVYERHESGLHTVIEATFQARYKPEEPCAVISLGSRIDAIRPGPGEARSASRQRVHATLGDPAVIEGYRQGFAALVNRVGEAVRKGFPEGQLAGGEPLAQVVKASRKTLTTTVNIPRGQRGLRLRDAPLRAHGHAGHGHYHDPWDDWYEDASYVEAEVDALEVFALAATHGHHHGHGIHVVHENGAPICEADAMLDAAPALAGVDTVGAVFDQPPGTNIDDALGGYGASDPKPTEWSSGSDGSSSGAGSSDGGSSDCSWSKDCAGSDCASSDCMSKDCASSDCASSDCSKDCASSDCASSDCASSDCASSDCASSDCASSDCASSDCSRD